MSHLLIHWLNDEVGLSQRVDDHFGETFKDGYLFGELLFRYNQQLDFDQFCNDRKAPSILRNFELLHPTMVKIGVTFNSRIANDILKGDKKVIKCILYEMKVALENLRRNSGQTIPNSLRVTKY
jgi:hypothetical protein